MAQSSWPNAPEYSEGSPVEGTGETSISQYHRQHSRYQDSGVEGDPDGDVLKVSADGSDMTVDVEAGFAHVHGQAFESTAVETLTIGASGGATRYDAVVLRLDPTEAAEADRLKLVVLSGVGNPPTLEQDYESTGIFEEPLALVTVGAGVSVIQAANVTDLRRFLGERIRKWTTANRPTGFVGALGFNVTTLLFEGWNGTAYKPLAFGYEPIISETEPTVGPAGQLWIKPATA